MVMSWTEVIFESNIRFQTENTIQHLVCIWAVHTVMTAVTIEAITTIATMMTAIRPIHANIRNVIRGRIVDHARVLIIVRVQFN
jgi:hypothetical protein